MCFSSRWRGSIGLLWGRGRIIVGLFLFLPFHKPFQERKELIEAVLEVLATVTEYQKKGLGSRLLEEVCAKADKEGLELYLDAGKAAMPLYEKFGFVEQVEKQDPKASVPMLRGARKEGE